MKKLLLLFTLLLTAVVGAKAELTGEFFPTTVSSGYTEKLTSLSPGQQVPFRLLLTNTGTETIAANTYTFTIRICKEDGTVSSTYATWKNTALESGASTGEGIRWTMKLPTASGTYYAEAVDETAGLSFKSETFTLKTAPSVTIDFTNVDGSSTAKVGEPKTLRLTVTNSSLEDEVTDRTIYLYVGNVSDQSDYTYITANTGTIEPSESKDLDYTWTPTKVGSFYFYAYDGIKGSYTDFKDEITVTDQYGLTAGDAEITVAPTDGNTTLQVNSEKEFTITVKNPKENGMIPAFSLYPGYQLSTAEEGTNLMDGSEDLDIAVANLEAGASATYTFSWTPTETGSYYVYVDQEVTDTTYYTDLLTVADTVQMTGGWLSMYGYNSTRSSYANYRPSYAVDNDGKRTSASDPLTGKIRYVFTNYEDKGFTGYIALGVKNGDSYTLISDKKAVTCRPYDSANDEYFYVNADTLSFSYAFPVGTTEVYGLVSEDGEEWDEADDNGLFAYEFTVAEDGLTSAEWYHRSISLSLANADSYGTDTSSTTYYQVLTNQNLTFNLTVTNNAKEKVLPETSYYGVERRYSSSRWSTNYDNEKELEVGEVEPGESKTTSYTYSFSSRTYRRGYVYDEYNYTASGDNFHVYYERNAAVSVAPADNNYTTTVGTAKQFTLTVKNDTTSSKYLVPSKTLTYGWKNNKTGETGYITDGGANKTFTSGNLTNDTSVTDNFDWTPTAEGEYLIGVQDSETNEWYYSEVVTVTVADGISSLNVDNASDAPVYNLSGQRVGKSYKGVVIQNGKKRIIK